MKINANFRLFAASHFDATKYIASPAAKVSRFMLDRIGDEKARATSIVEYQANSSFPQHTHVGGEEFLVLSGTFKDQYGEFPAGTYCRNPIGSQHEPWVDADGCTILVKLLQMNADENIDANPPMHMSMAEQEAAAVATSFGKVASLYHNPQTGECVEMCWLSPNEAFTTTTTSTNVAGEELFILKGTLEIMNIENDKVDIYRKWGWLRFPPTESEEKRRSSLRAGPEGAQVWRKTGHLTEKALSMEKIQIDPQDESVIMPKSS